MAYTEIRCNAVGTPLAYRLYAPNKLKLLPYNTQIAYKRLVQFGVIRSKPRSMNKL
jgi:hypothetical protein